MLEIRPVPGTRVMKARAPTPDEVRRLFQACAHSPMGLRDAALLALLYGAGLRRQEAVDVRHPGDVDLRAATVHVCRGKGNRERLVAMPPNAAAHVAAWVAFRGDEPGALLWPCAGRNGWMIHRGLNPDTVRTALQRLAFAAGLPGQARPHDLRAAHGTHLLERDVDPFTVQKQLGHASTATTLIYDRRPLARQSDAVARALDVPPPRSGPGLVSRTLDDVDDTAPDTERTRTG